MGQFSSKVNKEIWDKVGVRSLAKPLVTGENSKLCIIVLKKYNITFSIPSWSFHKLGVFLQYKRAKPSIGDIWMFVKILNVFIETINQG